MGHRKLAFVLGGGGARGALQVGALRALLEAGLTPDLTVLMSGSDFPNLFIAAVSGWFGGFFKNIAPEPRMARAIYLLIELLII
jgi:hypothetical protein